MDDTPIQDRYPDDYAHCYGCGRHNGHGHRLQSRWDGEECLARFAPRPEHTSLPGFAYGGLVASLVDCHAMATASAVLTAPGEEAVRCVTASLKVDFLRPTPLGPVLELRARPREAKPRKVIVEVRLFADGVECARGEVVAVRRPDSMAPAR